MVDALDTSHLLYSTVAALGAAGVQSGAQAWATDGRKSGEALGAGTGVLVYADNIAGTVTWRCLATDLPVES